MHRQNALGPSSYWAAVFIDHVELVFLAPNLGGLLSEQAKDPAYRMLLPGWLFSGRIRTPDGIELIYQAYVGAVNP